MTTSLARPHPTPISGRRPGDLLAASLFALAAGLAVNSIVGPLVLDLVDYPLTETLRNQTIGLDAATLLVVSPVSVVAGWLVRRQHCVGPLLAVVVGSYTAYMYLQFVVGPDYSHYPGSLALQLGLFTLGWMVAVGGWRATTAAELPEMPQTSRVRHSWVLVGLAGFVVFRYLPAIPASFAGDPIPAESVGDPAMYWSILLMDLGIFVPAVAATAAALRRGTAWALRGFYVAVGWFVLVTVAVLSMSIVLVANDDSYGAAAQISLFTITATVTVGYAVSVWGRLVGGDRDELGRVDANEQPESEHAQQPSR